MKRTLITLVSFAIVFLTAPFSHAQSYLTDNATATATARAPGRGEIYRAGAEPASSPSFGEEISGGREARRASSTRSVDGHLTAQEHRSAVTALVESLLHVAESEDESGLGEQIRVIARAQREAEATTTSAMQQIAYRSAFKTFLIGSDYKNLGLLKDELAMTRKHVYELRNIRENMSDEATRAALDTQILVLEKNRVILERFIAAHESNFGIFSWLARFIARA